MLTRIALAALFLAPGAFAQTVSVGVGPSPAPIGGTVFASATNNFANQLMGIGACPWRIVDSNGIEVFDPNCSPGSFLLSPLGTIDFSWDQRDQNGLQVPPGDYVFEVATAGGFFAVDFEVGGLESNIFLQGTAAIGTAPFGFNGGRDIAISSPSNPGAIYGVFVSGSLGGGPTFCGMELPIALDSIALSALESQLINNAVGILDANGERSRLLSRSRIS